MPRELSFSRTLAGVIVMAAATPGLLTAQLSPPSTGGMAALEEALRPLGQNKRLLIIGAHPDDEDTALLTLAVRKLGAEAAYLSLNRGEGGQNLIGPELGEALGLIRTEELLAARRIDGARQFFTRAYDFGYSKTLDDTWRHWPRDSVLKDVVRIIRRFQPQVVVSVFSGTDRDGHGQHQAAGWAAHEAFRVSGNPEVFPELLIEEGLPPWAPTKLYRSARFTPRLATLLIPAGDLDPVVGQSYSQIAMRSRSQHRSQDMGRLQLMGPYTVRLELVEGGSAGDPERDDLFRGVDTDLLSAASSSGVDENLPALATRYRSSVEAAKQLPRPDSLAALADALEEAWGHLDALMGAVSATGQDEGGFLVPPPLHDQSEHLAQALRIARGVMIDVVADRRHSTPGDTLTLLLLSWNTAQRPLGVAMWPQQRIGGLIGNPAPTGGGVVDPHRVDSLSVGILTDRLAIDPYFLEAPRAGAMYRWTAPAGVSGRGLFSVLGLPFEPWPVRGSFTLMLERGEVSYHREASFRVRDQARGEVRDPVMVLPRVDVLLEPRYTVLRVGGEPSRLTVTLSNNTTTALTGEVRLQVPRGWPGVTPQDFRLEANAGAVHTFSVVLPEGLGSGEFTIAAVARTQDGEEFNIGVVTVAYPHIHARVFTREAVAGVQVADLEVPSLASLGYIRGAADRVPEALLEMGLPVTIIDEATLAHGDLDTFDAIVVGSRAYEVDSALVRYNDRLMAYVRAGGLLLVQYQQYQFFDGGFAPFPLSVGGRPLVGGGSTSAGSTPGRNTHDRVADQTAPVRVLDPDDPLLQQPNRLSDEDWEGWVQERGLYFARSWDSRYHPILEMHDPGEGPLEGGILVADVEDGRYVYTGISFFRQLPAGVPGAYRLFMNMLALAKRKGVS